MALHPSPRLLAAASLLLALVACDAPAPVPEARATATTATTATTAAAPSAADSVAAHSIRGLARLVGAAQPAKPWAHDFKDPPAGPRAPSTAAFGATIGSSTFTDVDALVQRLGLECGDTSIRAMMDRRRVSEKAKVAEAQARGEDAVTAASWVNKRSKREANPQLRFSCPKIRSEQLGDRPRPPSSGRLLYIFDDAAYPLRHSSYQRTHRDHAAALADFNDTVAALTRAYGPPTKPLNGELPVPDKAGQVEFSPARNLEISWEFADILVRANIMRYGEIVTIGERVEVPHGLRPDAPRFVAGQTPPLSQPADLAAPATPAASAAPATPATPAASAAPAASTSP